MHGIEAKLMALVMLVRCMLQVSSGPIDAGHPGIDGSRSSSSSSSNYSNNSLLSAAVAQSVADGAPWALDGSQTAGIVVVVSTRRGASTAIAEGVGAHPCAYSFNEILGRPQFPVGYSKYDHHSNLQKYLGGRKKLLSGNQANGTKLLEDARSARELFCAARPRVVREACGDVCVVALKMHVDDWLPQRIGVGHHLWASWEQLVTAPDVAAVVVTRDTLQNFCSLHWAIKTNCWGHDPSQQANRKKRPPCVATRASRQFAARVESAMNFTRNALASKGRPWLDLPFETYVADPAAGLQRVLGAAGLAVPPLPWSTTCAVAWCETKRKSWPACGGDLATCLAIN